MLNSYFDKRKGLANSMANVGGSIGSLVFPLLIRYLLDTYGLRGALMIVSGLLLNLIATGALMRPFPVTEDDDSNVIVSEQDICVEEIKDCALDNGSMKTYIPNGMGEEEKSTKFVRLQNQISMQSNQSVQSKYLGSVKSIDKVLSDLTRSTLDLYGSMGNLASPMPVVTIGHSEISSTESLSCHSSSEHLCGSNCCSKLFAFSLFKNYKFKLLMLTGFLCIFGSALTITFIPPYAKDYNIPDDKIALLITISAICDFIGRFSVAWVADSGVIRRNHLVGFCIAISGVAAMLNFLYTDFPSFAAYSAIYGLVGGVYFSFYPLLIVEAVGQENLNNGLAILFQVHGVSLMLNSFLIGRKFHS